MDVFLWWPYILHTYQCAILIWHFSHSYSYDLAFLLSYYKAINKILTTKPRVINEILTTKLEVLK